MITWFLVAIGLIIAEILTLNLVLASFGLGALTAGLASFAGANFAVQFTALIIGALLSLLIVRPAVLKRLYQHDHKTGIDKLIGQQATAIEEITTQAGTIRIHGEVWTARTESGQIPAGSQVTFKKVNGAIAIVG